MAYRDADREIGSQPDLHYATAKLELEYLRPTPLGAELEIQARIVARTPRTYVLSATVVALGKTCISARVEAIAVPLSWVSGERE